MNANRFRKLIPTLFWAAACLVSIGASFSTTGLTQGPAPTFTPTVGASDAMYITVISTEPQINVRGGPSSVAYPIVGFLLPGETAPALGRSPGGDWIQVGYTGAPTGVGWVYSPLVSLSPGTLRIIEPPPTPVPPPTNTLDPTLAAQFNTIPTTTRLPTYTPPAESLEPPTFPSPAPMSSTTAIPMGVTILAFISIGSVGLLFSQFGRR
jgi:hypothetical protein